MHTTATAIHSRRIVAGAVPAARMSLAEPIASGRLETKMAASRLTLTPSPVGEADAEHRLLGDAVEEGAEGERRAGAAARPRAARRAGRARSR